ncbi:carotenoid oxygenase family protein [Leptolyngbya sp. BC1307]|uniref:carotenoid oxygenase family protein n=1 Tax=Leptolyngbya sp. BC1307 TaxID=2029589 RepID=UPI000EFC5EF9|nr:carotenoid oxygenase family protein [Leptolyngbya sp. BC1307]
MTATTASPSPASQRTSQRTTGATPAPQPWHKSLAQPASEFATTPLQIISGRIPAGLRGTLYQNGTGRLQRGGQPVGHWFDGDGAILRVNLTDTGATGTYRYVQTEGYQAESKADKFLYGNYGMRYPGPLWEHIWGLINSTSIKNSANTSVLALPNKLLALWEAGNPHSLDLETLETFGRESLGWLKKGQPFSAHPLRDPLSGEIYSIGVTPQCNLAIYRCDRACNLIRQTTIPLKDVPLVHSFVMAGSYLVFLVSPVTVEMLPLLLNRRSYADSMRWRSDRGTRVIVVDRESLEIVSEERAEPWFQWHFGNGCLEEDGTVRMDFARFDDFPQINEALREVPSGQIKTTAYGSLWQLRLNPQTGHILSNERVLDRDCEFPQVPAAQVGQPWQQTYVLMHRLGVSTGQDWFGAIGRFDYSTGRLTEADLGAGYYGTEPLHVADRLNPEEGWLLTVVYSAADDRSELWIFAAELGEPVCRLALPGVVPLGFHGTWQIA